MAVYWWWMFRLWVILFMNDSACRLCNTNSVDGLILFHNKCRVQNGRTQDNVIRRIIRVWKRRLRYRMHVITQWIHNQACTKIGRVMLGGCDGWTNVCVCSLASLCDGGFVWWGDNGQSLVIATMFVRDCIAPSLKYVDRGLILNFFLGLDDFLRWYSNLFERYGNLIYLFEASNCKSRKHCQNSIGDSCGAFRCCNIFLSRGSRSKWWKVDPMRSQKWSSECMLPRGRL